MTLLPVLADTATLLVARNGDVGIADVEQKSCIPRARRHKRHSTIGRDVDLRFRVKPWGSFPQIQYLLRH